MNLLNYTLKYLSITLLVVISIWAFFFYFNMIDEIMDSIDDGLRNDKILVINKVESISTTIERAGFRDHNYSIVQIKEKQGLDYKDVYKDTLMYTLNEKDLEPFRLLTTAFRHDNKYYELKVVASTVEQDDLVRELFYGLVWLYIVILISVFVINNWLLRKIWIPFYLLLDRLKAFRLDRDKGIKTAETSVKEFKELNETVSSLVEQTVGTYSSQKQFIENAAHEIQTPLAISLNRLELLAENEDLSDNHLEAIGRVIRTLERLTKLNKSLLLISKIENRQYGELEGVSINALVKMLVVEFSDFAELKNITIALEDNGRIEASMNKDLAAILVSNLLKNAIAHNFNAGKISVRINSHSLIIANTGTLSPLNPLKIFKRFEKDSATQESTGLGLAIVKAIIDLYGYKLSYSFAHQQHQMIIDFK